MSRVAVEIGGTFTDVMWVDGDRRLRTHKVPSTPSDPAAAVLSALEEVGADAELGGLEGFYHGSTVATNAVLTRRGARTGLLVTRGFRDLLTLQRQLRANVYDLAPVKPEPIVPSRLVREVDERVDHRGEAIAPLDEEGVVAAVRELVEQQRIETLAICFLHAYRNDAHEQRAAELVAAAFPQLPIMVSSDVLPVFREYERASATAICAYVVRGVRDYLHRLEARFEGAGTPMFVMQSSGGVLPPRGIARRPLEMLESGPAAGVTAALAVAQELGHPNVVTLDMGGTSTDVCLITDHRPEQSSEREIDGLPLGIPSLDIVNVGAGGGSLGGYDAGGMLQVGPQSAGAEPGPACYRKGGERPALTDALVALGWLRPEAFLGGRMTLAPELADAALARLAAGGSDADGAAGPPETAAEVADAMVQIAIAHMARGVSQVSVQRGRDPEAYALYAFGGMGPMVGALVAEQLKVRRVVVPVHPGLFSAFGLLLADLKRTYEQTEIAPVDDADRLLDGFERLERQALEELAGYGCAPEAVAFEHTVAMRYEGQGFELPVPVEPARVRDEGAPYLIAAFHRAHELAYGTAVPATTIEAVTLRLEATVPRGVDGGAAAFAPAGGADGEPTVRTVRFGGEELECTFVARASLSRGARIDGPAVVEEATATTLVPPGWRCEVAAEGSLIIESEAA